MQSCKLNILPRSTKFALGVFILFIQILVIGCTPVEELPEEGHSEETSAKPGNTSSPVPGRQEATATKKSAPTTSVIPKIISPLKSTAKGLVIERIATPAPKFGHADDYAWVAGELKYQPLEGGCWTLIFSEEERNKENYYGLFALEFQQELDLAAHDGQFVMVTGAVFRQEVSMACPPTVYGVSNMFLNKP